MFSMKFWRCSITQVFGSQASCCFPAKWSFDEVLLAISPCPSLFRYSPVLMSSWPGALGHDSQSSTFTFTKRICPGCRAQPGVVLFSFLFPVPVTLLFSCWPWTAIISACFAPLLPPLPEVSHHASYPSLRFTSRYLCKNVGMCEIAATLPRAVTSPPNKEAHRPAGNAVHI